jgi:hypothetical protein
MFGLAALTDGRHAAKAGYIALTNASANIAGTRTPTTARAHRAGFFAFYRKA